MKHSVLDPRPVVEKFYVQYVNIKDRLIPAIKFTPGNDGKLGSMMPGDYAGIVLNRIIFTVFLQVPRGNLQPLLPARFLQDLHGRYRSGELASYSSLYHLLCTLWFSFLHDDRPRTASDGIFQVVPFVGGNMFQPVPGVEITQSGDPAPTIDIQDAALASVLDMVSQFEWNIEETSAATSVAIDPAVLGYIFEMSCNRKESGTYYTPDVITRYIAQSCMSIHLTRNVNDHFHATYSDFMADVLFKEIKTREDLELISWCYFTIVTRITTCDPACGSGAFLVAMERVLVDIYLACLGCMSPEDPGFRDHPGLPSPGSSLFDIKRHVILASIFGVDVQQGSVEIAKLRLSLSLISTLDLARGDRLPVLDENIKTGNSLLGFISSSVSANKLDIHGINVAEAFCRGSNTPREKSIARSGLDAAYVSSLGNLKRVGSIPLFHWGLEFPGIVQGGGFDLILGNPPYLSFSSSKAKKQLIGKELIQALYKNTDDIYEAFVLRALKLCRGVVGLIVPYSFYRQVGARITRHVIAYDNLGEGIFVGVSIAVAIAFLDNATHSTFDFRNYTFLPGKTSRIGRIPSTRVVSFELFKDDPIIVHINAVARTHASYGLEVTRGEELGKKALAGVNRAKHVPIFTANEMTPYKLFPAKYRIDIPSIKKGFYHQDKIGVNLAFRNRIKATLVKDVYTIKSIICIYNGTFDTLLEVLGTWNSKLFDWYHDKCFSNFQEIRLNTIADIKNKYPLLLPDRFEFREIVKYLTVKYHSYLQLLVDYIIYGIFFEGKLELANGTPLGQFTLLDAIRPHLVPVDYETWSRLHWRGMRGESLDDVERDELARVEKDIVAAIDRVVDGVTSDARIQHILDAMKQHPWISRIEAESVPKQVNAR